MYYKEHRTAVFVDGSNTYICAAKCFNRKIDYQKLLDYAVDGCSLYRAIIYAVKHGNMDSWSKALWHMGYETRIKEPMYYGDNSKADWDVQIVMDIVRMIEQVDVITIVSGDGDFIPVVEWCQGRGRIVKVVGVEQSTSRELKDRCDKFMPVTPELMFPDPINRPPATESPKITAPSQSSTAKISKPRESERKFGTGLLDNDTPKDLGMTDEERRSLDKAIEQETYSSGSG